MMGDHALQNIDTGSEDALWRLNATTGSKKAGNTNVFTFYTRGEEMNEQLA